MEDAEDWVIREAQDAAWGFTPQHRAVADAVMIMLAEEIRVEYLEETP